ncbi:MAG TPA: electron transfer flavoprotein subunit beta/FixA family protein [Thermoplasmata archaeon]|nr:electron transfer flavoprotein subunit beta/FixA family protein [Thermoplasmata archaeon]
MDIVVLIKPVPEPETKLRPTADGTRLDGEGVKFVLAGYDESAVEQALLLKESVPGSTVRAIALGPAPRTEEVLRSALALGCDAAAWVEAPSTPDAVGTAKLLAEAVRRAKFELVLAGKEAGDEQSGLVGAALAEFLGVPDYGFVVDLRYDAAAGRLKFQRAVEGGLERLESGLPCVMALQQAWNDPRTAKLANILKSRKAPIERLTAADLGGGTPRAAWTGFRLPPPRTGARLIEYKTPEEAAEKLVRILKEEAKVFP